MKIEKDKGIHVDYEIDNIFGEGMYEVGIYVKSKDRSKEYVEIDNAYKFTIVDRGPNGYMLHPRVKVNVC